jgi:hypothetical protein
MLRQVLFRFNGFKILILCRAGLDSIFHKYFFLIFSNTQKIITVEFAYDTWSVIRNLRSYITEKISPEWFHLICNIKDYSEHIRLVPSMFVVTECDCTITSYNEEQLPSLRAILFFCFDIKKGLYRRQTAVLDATISFFSIRYGFNPLSQKEVSLFYAQLELWCCRRKEKFRWRRN